MKNYNSPYLNALLSGKLSEIEKAEADCTHHIGTESTLTADVIESEFVAECSICKSVINVSAATRYSEDDIANMVSELVGILESAKYMALDIMPKSTKAPEYFSIIPMLKRFPKIYEIIRSVKKLEENNDIWVRY